MHSLNNTVYFLQEYTITSLSSFSLFVPASLACGECTRECPFLVMHRKITAKNEKIKKQNKRTKNCLSFLHKDKLNRVLDLENRTMQYVGRS